MSYCIYCGMENDENSRVCKNCGAKIGESSEQNNSEYNYNVQYSNMQYRDKTDSNKKDSKKILKNTIIAFVATSVVMLFVLFLFGGNETKEVKNTMNDFFRAYNNEDAEAYMKVFIPESVLNYFEVDAESYESIEEELFYVDEKLTYKNIEAKDIYPVDTDKVEQYLYETWYYYIEVDKACGIDIVCDEGIDGEYEKKELVMILYKNGGNWYVYDVADK